MKARIAIMAVASLALAGGVAVAGPASSPATAPAGPALEQRAAVLIARLDGPASSDEKGDAIDELIRMGPAAIPAVMKDLERINSRLLYLSLVLKKIGAAAVPAILKASDGDWTKAANALAVLGLDARSAVPAIVAGLKDPRSEQRAAAAVILGTIGAPAKDAVPALIGALNDPDETVRSEAADAISEIGKLGAAASAMPALLERLKDPDRSVRANAVDAIGSIARVDDHGRDIVSALLVASRDPDAWVRARAFKSLGSVGRQSDEAMAALVSAVQHETDTNARQAAIQSLGRGNWPAEKTCPVLVPLLRDKDEAIRDEAARAVGGFGPPAVASLAPLLTDPSADVRVAALEAVAAIGDGAEPLLPTLAGLLGDGDLRVRSRAAGAIGSIGLGADICVPVLRTVLGDASPSVRGNALGALGEMGPAALPAVPSMLAHLKDPDQDVRRSAGYAVKSLTQWPLVIHSPSSMRDVAAMLSDPDAETRERAAAALGIFGGDARAPVPDLVRAFRSKAITGNEIRVFGEIGDADPAVISLLSDLLRDRRRSGPAIPLTLAQFGPAARGAVPALIEALDADNEFTRQNAAYALGRIGADAAGALPALDRLAASRGTPGLCARVAAARIRGDNAAALRLAAAGMAEPLPEPTGSIGDILQGMLSTRNLALSYVASIARDDPSQATEAVRILSAAMSDPRGDGEFRFLAADSLGEIGPPAKSAVPAIRELLRHAPNSHRKWLRVALRKIMTAG